MIRLLFWMATGLWVLLTASAVALVGWADDPLYAIPTVTLALISGGGLILVERVFCRDG